MWHSRSRVASAGAAAALVAFQVVAAQALADPAAPQPGAATAQDRADKEMELRGVEDTMRASDDQRRAIEAEIDSIRADRARLSAALIETTATVQETERGVASANERLAGLNAKAEELARSLDRRRGAITEVLAALQRMGSDPPPAILVKPHDMSEAVMAATVLSSVIPELKSATEAIGRDLDALSKTKDFDRA